MSESDETNPLIRLKRYEQPPAEFVEEFVLSFQDRQRSELLRQSARSLLWERITTYFDEMTTPRWGVAFAGLVAMASVGYMLRPLSHPIAPLAQAAAQESSPAQETYIIRAITAEPLGVPVLIDGRTLISRHYVSGFSEPQYASVLQADVALNGDAMMLFPR